MNLSLVKFLLVTSVAMPVLLGPVQAQSDNDASTAAKPSATTHVRATGNVPGAAPDWLIEPAPFKASVGLSQDKRSLTLSNGLLRRTILLTPNAATVEYDNPASGKTILRAVKPEAEITLNGHKWGNWGARRPDVPELFVARDAGSHGGGSAVLSVSPVGGTCGGKEI